MFLCGLDAMSERNNIREVENTSTNRGDRASEGIQNTSVDSQVGGSRLAEIHSGREDTASRHIPDLSLDGVDDGINPRSNSDQLASASRDLTGERSESRDEEGQYRIHGTDSVSDAKDRDPVDGEAPLESAKVKSRYDTGNDVVGADASVSGMDSGERDRQMQLQLDQGLSKAGTENLYGGSVLASSSGLAAEGDSSGRIYASDTGKPYRDVSDLPPLSQNTASQLYSDAQSYGKHLQGPLGSAEWQDQSGSTDDLVERRTGMISQALNRSLAERSLPPVTVSAEPLESSNGGNYHPSRGHIQLNRDMIAAGDPKIAGVAAHESTHHDQNVLATLAHQQKVGQLTFGDELVRQELAGANGGGFRGTINPAGRPLSEAEMHRGNQAMDDRFDYSGEFKDFQIASALRQHLPDGVDQLHRASPEDMLSHQMLGAIFAKAPDSPAHAAILNSPHMDRLKGQVSFAPDGSLEPWDEKTEMMRKGDLARALDNIAMDSFFKEQEMHPIYQSWSWEREARHSQGLVDQMLKKE